MRGDILVDRERHRQSVRDSRYMLSEHVVRSLMSGGVGVADIEAAVLDGQVIEVHSHGQRGVSYLVAVLRPRGPVHVMCSAGAGGWLVVSFAYVPAQPVWATPGRRNQKGERSMNEAFTHCFFCAGEIKKVTVGSFDYRKEGRLYVIKRVPAGLCLECGEKYVTPDVGKQMDKMIEKGQFTATEAVAVIEFQRDLAE